MKIKKIIAAVVASALALSLTILTINAVPLATPPSYLDGATTKNGRTDVYDMAKQYRVLVPGTGKMTVRFDFTANYYDLNIMLPNPALCDYTQPMNLQFKCTDASITNTNFNETFVIKGENKSLIPSAIEYIDELYSSPRIDVNYSAFIYGETYTGEFTFSVRHAFETRAELIDYIAPYDAEWDYYGYGGTVGMGEALVENFASITEFTPATSTIVRRPYRSGVNTTSQVAPIEIGTWLKGVALPAANINFEGELVEQYEVETDASGNPIYYEPEYNNTTELHDLYIDNLWQIMNYTDYGDIYIDEPEDAAYIVVKKDEKGKLVIDRERMSLNNYQNFIAIVNDNSANYDNTEFKFYTAADGVITRAKLAENMDWVRLEMVNPSGLYATEVLAAASDRTKNSEWDKKLVEDQYKMPFRQDLYNLYGDDGDNAYAPFDKDIYFTNGIPYNLTSTALLVNSPNTMQLIKTEAFDYGSNYITFDLASIKDNTYADLNVYLNMIFDLRLATSQDWYWDKMEVRYYDYTGDSGESEAGIVEYDIAL
jgi:hypothetical protein